MSIMSLKVTYVHEWLHKWCNKHGYSIETHPNYLALEGDIKPMKQWMESMKISWRRRVRDLFTVYMDIKDHGIKEPILIYSDMRINTGHKRASILHSMGHKTIKAIVVPDDTKL